MVNVERLQAFGGKNKAVRDRILKGRASHLCDSKQMLDYE